MDQPVFQNLLLVLVIYRNLGILRLIIVIQGFGQNQTVYIMCEDTAFYTILILSKVPDQMLKH